VKRKESGYTLVELLVSLAITGLVFIIAGAAIHQLSTISGYGNDRMTAVHEMQNTAFWLNRDGQEAAMAAGDKNLLLTLPDGQTVTYGLDKNNLQRITASGTRILAQNVESLSFQVKNNLVTMDYCSLISGRMEDNVKGTYSVCLRSMP
jgi:prepilin-type N-terminal cleavage/methylation domain-containing protein